MMSKRRKSAVLVCSAMLAFAWTASIALAGSACGEKAAPSAEQPKKHCGFCDKLSNNGNCAEQPKKHCGFCDKLFHKERCEEPAAMAPAAPNPCPGNGNATSALPPNAAPGECYARAIVPAEYKTVTERHMVQPASERIEVVPATYKWVDEQVTVKEASTRLETVPAEYEWREQKIEVKPAHTGWVMQNGAECTAADNKAVEGGVYCLKTTPAEYKTVRTQCMVKPASVRTITIPAEYKTVSKQIVDRPATTNRIPIPAQYEDVQRTVLVCPERVKWEHVVCEEKLSSDTVNKVKSSLLASGYKPGPMNGKITQEDRIALTAFQTKNHLGVGYLSYETLKQLGVTVQ